METQKTQLDEQLLDITSKFAASIGVQGPFKDAAEAMTAAFQAITPKQHLLSESSKDTLMKMKGFADENQIQYTTTLFEEMELERSMSDDDWSGIIQTELAAIPTGDDGVELDFDDSEYDYTDDDLDGFIGDLSDDDIFSVYEDDELEVEDEDDETFRESLDQLLDSELLNEVLSRGERIKAGIRMKRRESNTQRKLKIALKRRSDSKTINKRARRLAVKVMKQRLLRGKNVNKLSVGEKERVERTLQKRKAVLGRLAMKLTSRVRQTENARINNKK